MVTGDLEVDDALSFFSELTSSLVRCQATYLEKNGLIVRTVDRSCDYYMHRGSVTHFHHYWLTSSRYWVRVYVGVFIRSHDYHVIQILK